MEFGQKPVQPVRAKFDSDLKHYLHGEIGTQNTQLAQLFRMRYTGECKQQIGQFKMGKTVKLEDLGGHELTHAEANFVIEYSKDFAPRRAAEASGFAADSGYDLRNRPNIQAAINIILLNRLKTADMDAEWILHEMHDNHMIARQQGNINASNTALRMLGKHNMIDAFAADKVELVTDDALTDRLKRGRQRQLDRTAPVPQEPGLMETIEVEEVSFL